MPVEINEIVITATIAEAVPGNTAKASANNQSSVNAEIVKACVEEVLRVLKEKQER